MNEKRTRRPLLILGAVIVVLAIVFNFIYSGGNVIPGVGRTSQVQDEYLKQQVLKADDAFNKGDRNGAIDVLRALVNRYPHEDRVFFLLGSYLLASNVFDSAGKVKNASLAGEGLGFIKKATELAPEKDNYQLVYAVLLSELHHDSESVVIFEKFFTNKEFRAHPKHRYLVVNYADSLARIGMREKVLDEYKKSLAVTNTDDKISVEYAHLLKAR